MTFPLHIASADKAAQNVGHPNLNNMRKFHLACPICQNVSDKLNWRQICELPNREELWA